MSAKQQGQYVRTGVAARALGVNPHIVRRLVDLRELKALSVPGGLPRSPGRSQRLVSVASLREYAARHDLPLDEEALQ